MTFQQTNTMQSCSTHTSKKLVITARQHRERSHKVAIVLQLEKHCMTAQNNSTANKHENYSQTTDSASCTGESHSVVAAVEALLVCTWPVSTVRSRIAWEYSIKHPRVLKRFA